MAGEIKLNDVSVATEDAGTVTIGNSNVTFDANTVTTNLAFAADHAGIKTALNASGSAPVYACRAWVNFNPSGTVAIRGSANVSSLADNGTGDYTVNFTTSMSDSNYSAVIFNGITSSLHGIPVRGGSIVAYSDSAIRVSSYYANTSAYAIAEDGTYSMISIFR